MPITIHIWRITFVAFLLGTVPAFAQSTTPPRPIRIDDLFKLKEVRDPRRSPDGKWVAYTVSRVIVDKDKNDSDVWMTSWDGREHIQLTSSPDSESTARWSPDDKYLAFLSSRDENDDNTQLWLLNRLGGEAIRVTDVKGDVEDYDWSPDGARIVLAVLDPDPEDADKSKTGDKAKPDEKKPKPIVIDRYHFKQDITGFLGARRTHLYVLDVATKKVEQITTGRYDEQLPAWSPDGKWIAFISKRHPDDPDRSNNSDVFVMEPRAGASVRQLTRSPHEDGNARPVWSPDSRWIAYLVGDELKYSAYEQNRLAVISLDGGEPKMLARGLDRPVFSPAWSADGRSIYVLIADDRAQYLSRVPVGDDKVERLVQDKAVVSAISGDGTFVALVSTLDRPAEVHAFENGKLRRLTHHNDEWLAGLQLGTTEDFTAKSKDGTEVHGLVAKPAGYTAGRRYPTIFWIHGGPNGQDDYSFDFERELFASRGYVVVQPNYRGSNGRGAEFQKAIYADWGGKEVVDIVGAVDHMIATGVADPARLGIGGWSYGGILTDATIATDQRFAAAIAGAGSANQLSMYGHDQYITQYEHEIGLPWKNPEGWMKVSYPFFKADRIKTPTLFVVGEKDFNVPAAGSEQMYQALRSLGVDTQLVIYPGQFHSIRRPSFKKDRLERYLAWYGKYMKPEALTTTAAR